MAAAENQATFLNFSFFKVDPKWRWLNEIGKEGWELVSVDSWATSCGREGD